MVIGLRGGHSSNCVGAIYLKDEYKCMQDLYTEVKRILESYGHTVIDCNSNASSQNGELSEGVRKSNNNNVDIFISLHMNAGGGTGTEAWVCNGSRAYNTAKRLVNNFVSLGFRSRGVKYSDKYYEMRNVKAPNIIFETLFCDSKGDTELWSATSWEDLARAVANAIDTNIPLKKVEFNPTHYAPSPCDIVNGAGEKIGELWQDEKVELLWIDDSYRKYVRFWNSSYEYLKEGYVSGGNIYKIGEEPKEEILYKVQLGSYSKKENAELKLKELSQKGEEGFIVISKKE